MKLDEIKELIHIFDTSSLSQLKLSNENFSIKLSKGTKAKVDSIESVESAEPKVIESKNIESKPQVIESKKEIPQAEFITSPMVGTFYRAPSPGAAPYVSIGDIVKKGQTIGIIEAMKIMNEIEAEFNCKIVEIEVNDGQPVEFGTKLIMIERV